MSSEGRTDYRKDSPEVLYQMRETVISMFKKKKPVEEIKEITGFCKRTIRKTISDYKHGGMAALKPNTRGRNAGEKRILTAEQEKEIVGIRTLILMICCLEPTVCKVDSSCPVREIKMRLLPFMEPVRIHGLRLQDCTWG